MTLPKVSDILGIINKIAPFSYAEGWDNVGLQVGDPGWPADKIMTALDPGPDTVAAALSSNCRLLVTHHPLFFNPLKKISPADPIGRVITEAVKHDLAIIASHTNYDVADGGINDLLAERLGLTGCTPLKLTGSDELVKLVVFVPKGHDGKVLDGLLRFSGFIGNYSDCSFSGEGIGTFKPLAGAHPFMGRIGKRERAEEVRIEVLLRRPEVSQAVAAMIKAHPYEEPAFDLYPLLNQGKGRGLGRIGKLVEAASLEVFAALVKARLSLQGLRYVGEPGRTIQSVALCGGSGMSLLREAAFRGADVLVTADVKYHEAREAESLGVALIDAGHFGTERVMVQSLAENLMKETAKRKLAAEVVPFLGEREPFSFM